MPVKVKKDHQKTNRKQAKTNISKLKRKTNPFDIDPIGRNILSSAAVVDICKAVDGMWMPNHFIKKGQEPVFTYDQLKDRLSSKTKTLTKASNDDSKPPWDSSPASNDSSCERDDSRGLYLWLEAYSGIGMDRSRPVSPTNPPWHMPINLSHKEKIKMYTRRAKSAKARIKHSKPTDTYQSKECYKVRSNGRYSFCGVVGWYGARPPTMAQLLCQAYSKGWTYRLHCEKPMSTRKVMSAPVEEVQLHDSHVYKYKLWAPDLHTFNEVPEIHTTNVVKINRVYNNHRRDIYYSWLRKHDTNNPHIDYVPMKHRKYVSSSDCKLSLLYGSRYEGQKAGSFAPIERFFKRTDWKAYDNWNRFLCYYHAYTKGKLTEEALVAIGNFIYKGTTCTVNAFPDTVQRASESDRVDNAIGNNQVLMLPPPAHMQIKGEDIRYTGKSNQVASITTTGHSDSDIQHLALRRTWKNLASSLNLPPPEKDIDYQQIREVVINIQQA